MGGLIVWMVTWCVFLQLLTCGEMIRNILLPIHPLLMDHSKLCKQCSRCPLSTDYVAYPEQKRVFGDPLNGFKEVGADSCSIIPSS